MCIRDSNKGMRFATAVRFDPDYVELAGVFRGDGRGEVAIAAPPGLGQLTSLPDDTLMGVQINGYDKGLEKGWPDFAKSFESAADVTIADLERGLGLRLPDDLINILGSTLTVALPDQRFGSDGPTFGVITTPKDVAEAERALGSALEALEAPLSMSVDGPKLVVASDEAYATRLKAGGTLGSVDGFATAVGDPSKAMYGFFINLDPVSYTHLDVYKRQTRTRLAPSSRHGGARRAPGYRRAGGLSRPNRRDGGTSKASQRASHTSRGVEPAASASVDVRPPKLARRCV